LALSLAAKGETVAVVCSGDAGYMVWRGLSTSFQKISFLEIEVISGVTAALAGLPYWVLR
jgi:precorrin-3B methylase